MSRLRCASCQGSFFRSDCESSNPKRLDFNGFQAHREKVVQTRPVDLIPCFGLSKKKLRGSIHVLQHSIVHEELVVCRSCDYQCKNLPEQQSSKDSSISWHFVSIEISPALVTLPLKKQTCLELPVVDLHKNPQRLCRSFEGLLSFFSTALVVVDPQLITERSEKV